jgi:ABC-type branched-subunit amino acid transport system substrate-binding protein
VKVWLAASCFGALLALSACAPSRVSPPEAATQLPLEVEEPTEIRVGLLLPLSGAAAPLGEDMLSAAQMALFDVGENDLVLLPRDTGGTATGARQAAQEVIEEGAEVILGPLFSQAVEAVGPVARQADIRVLAFSNAASAAKEDVFLLGFRPEEQVVRVVRYALDQGLVEIAGLAPDDPYGRTAMQALRQAVLERGGRLGPTVLYPPDQDPSPVVREVAAYDERRAALEAERERLKQQQDDPQAERELRRLETLDTRGPPRFDAILLADGGDRLRSVASLLAFFDVDSATSRFLGTMRWQDDPRVLEEPALRQGWYAAPPPDGMGAFEARFANAFGRRPQALAALAYDATALAVIVARDLGDRTFDPVTLSDAEGFAGASGLFRLRPDGLAEHGLAVLEMTGAGPRVVDLAPASFVGGLAAR